jgi:ribonuclease HI
MDTIIYTDGSADNTAGTGGWCAIVRSGSSLTELSGWEEPTTSNRMELMAAIEGLRSLTRPTTVTLVSDSAYMLNALENQWYLRWFYEAENFGSKRPNLDQWEILAGLMRFHVVQFEKVKGHSGDFWNERADAVAKHARLNKTSGVLVDPEWYQQIPCPVVAESGNTCKNWKGHFGGCYFGKAKVQV